jgi:hypothetical protein
MWLGGDVAGHLRHASFALGVFRSLSLQKEFTHVSTAPCFPYQAL